MHGPYVLMFLEAAKHPGRLYCRSRHTTHLSKVSQVLIPEPHTHTHKHEKRERSLSEDLLCINPDRGQGASWSPGWET